MKTSKTSEFTTFRSKGKTMSFLPIEMLIFLMSVTGADGMVGNLPVDSEP
jgi:hypothetical protein